MAASARHTLLRAAVAVAIASTLAGCATRYDAQRQPDLRLAVRAGHRPRDRLLESAPAATAGVAAEHGALAASRARINSRICRSTRSLTPAPVDATADRASAIMRPVLLLPANRPRLVALLVSRADARDGSRTPPCADAQPSAPAPSGAATLRTPTTRSAIASRSSRPRRSRPRCASAVDLIRWQDYEDMTEDLFDRLARDAVPQAKEAAATQGYFSADVDITRRPRDEARDACGSRSTPGAADAHRRAWRIDVTGPANDAPEGAAAIAKLRDEWLLPKGDMFRQEAWTAAKQPRGRHARRESVRGGEADAERGPHRSAPRTAPTSRVDDRQRAAVSHRRRSTCRA